MKFTIEGKDVITISEENYGNLPQIKGKIHLIELDFDINKENYDEIRSYVWKIFKTYRRTKRFIVSGKEESVKYWNKIFKTFKNKFKYQKWVFYKKFYIQNTSNCNIFYFFKKHNKVILNTRILDNDTLKCIENNLEGILEFVEIIKSDLDFYNKNKDVLLNWNGNIIISQEDKEIFIQQKETETETKEN